MSDIIKDLHDMADLLSAEEYSEDAERIRDAIDEIERLRAVAAADPAEPAVSPARGEDLEGLGFTPAFDLASTIAAEVMGLGWTKEGVPPLTAIEWLDGRYADVQRIADKWVRSAALLPAASRPAADKGFAIGQRVRKVSGSSWQGTVVGFYSTDLTPDGICVASERQTGSVQIYQAKALALLNASRGEPEGGQ